MVAKLTTQEKQEISSAIMEAEKLTGAEIAVVIAPASDGYMSHVFLIGLLLGSLLACSFWFAHIINSFLIFLAIQLSVICAYSFIPPLRNSCLYFIPSNIQRHRASHRAYAEYVLVSRNVPASVPVVLLYISLAEHYAHIIPGRLINEKIPEEHWDYVVKEFIVQIHKSTVCNSCIGSIAKIAELLAPHFPAANNPNYISDHIIETK
jgi:putative membrane protein